MQPKQITNIVMEVAVVTMVVVVAVVMIMVVVVMVVVMTVVLMVVVTCGFDGNDGCGKDDGIQCGGGGELMT